MKIKFAKPTFPGQDHVVIMVEHGAENDQLFTKHASIGEVLTVPDDLGYRILSQYRGVIELVGEDKSVAAKDVVKK